MPLSQPILDQLTSLVGHKVTLLTESGKGVWPTQHRIPVTLLTAPVQRGWVNSKGRPCPPSTPGAQPHYVADVKLYGKKSTRQGYSLDDVIGVSEGWDLRDRAYRTERTLKGSPWRLSEKTKKAVETSIKQREAAKAKQPLEGWKPRGQAPKVPYGSHLKKPKLKGSRRKPPVDDDLPPVA